MSGLSFPENQNLKKKEEKKPQLKRKDHRNVTDTTNMCNQDLNLLWVLS